MEGETAARAAEAAARRAYGRLVAMLAARFRDLALAEDAVADALRIALERWPADGVPESPEAWLATVARRRLLDAMRRDRRLAAAGPELARVEEERMATASPWPDARLELMLTCAHPAVDAAVRAPLMLQAVLGFDAAEVASAFLVSPAAMAQRLVRAKRKIADAGLGFRPPEPEEAVERLEAALDAIYAAFGIAWSDPVSAARRDLSEDAIGLARLVVELAPAPAEPLGLLALMLFAHARRRARRDAAGRYAPLEAQDIGLWDGAAIAEAEAALARAASFGGLGRFRLEAAIQSAHCDRARSGVTRWDAIATLYAALERVAPSIGAACGHAAALAAGGEPAAALARLDAAPAERVAAYQPYWATRAESLRLLGRPEEARAAFGRAAGLADDAAVRAFLLDRAAGL